MFLIPKFCFISLSLLLIHPGPIHKEFTQSNSHIMPIPHYMHPVCWSLKLKPVMSLTGEFQGNNLAQLVKDGRTPISPDIKMLDPIAKGFWITIPKLNIRDFDF